MRMTSLQQIGFQSFRDKGVVQPAISSDKLTLVTRLTAFLQLHRRTPFLNINTNAIYREYCGWLQRNLTYPGLSYNVHGHFLRSLRKGIRPLRQEMKPAVAPALVYVFHRHSSYYTRQVKYDCSGASCHIGKLRAKYSES